MADLSTSAITIENFNDLIREELPFAWEQGFRVERLVAGEALGWAVMGEASFQAPGRVIRPRVWHVKDGERGWPGSIW